MMRMLFYGSETEVRISFALIIKGMMYNGSWF